MRSRLFTRTLRGMIVLFALFAAATAIYSGILLHQHLIHESEVKAQAIAHSVAGADLDSIYGRDVVAIQARIDEFLSIKGVGYVIAADRDGVILAHTLVPGVPGKLRALVKSMAGQRLSEVRVVDRDLDLGDAGRAIHVVMPVFEGIGGFVHVGMDRDAIDSFIDQTMLRQQGLAAVFFLISAMLAWFFLRTVARPLTSLAVYADRVANHDFTQPLPAISDDEVGDLARAMGSMSSDLSRLIMGLEQEVGRATYELEDALGQLSTIVGGMADGLLVTDRSGTILRTNPALLELFGFTAAIEGQPVCGIFLQQGMNGEENSAFLDQILHPPDAVPDAVPGVVPDAVPDAVPGAVAGGVRPDAGNERWHGEVLVGRVDGSSRWVEFSVVRWLIKGESCNICLLRDVTERRAAQQSLRRAHDELEEKVRERTATLSRVNAQLLLENSERRTVEQALRRAEARYRGIFENALEGIFQCGRDGHFLSVNPALARLLGYDTPQDLLAPGAPAVKSFFMEDAHARDLGKRLDGEGQLFGRELQIRRRDGELIWVSVNARRVCGPDGVTLYYEGFVEDVTLGHLSRERLEYQAYHDPLTGLPNRLLFLDHLQMAIRRAQRRKEYCYAVLYLDLDRFKVVNDSIGHDVGDDLLRHVADKLLTCVREVDTVARFGGDEFAILLEETPTRATAIQVARRINAHLAEPVMLSGHEVLTSASIGLVIRMDGYTTPDEVLRDADTAMYRAKELGKSRFKVFNKRMRHEAMRLLAIEMDLRYAVDRGEMALHYQPLVDLDTGRVMGFEALMRWTRPDGRMIPPSEFIPVAEDSGLINALGTFALRDVCSRFAPGNGIAPPIVHVNISGRQFLHPGFTQEVEHVLYRTGIDPAFLRFEITESVLLRHGSHAVNVMRQLRESGIRLCLDDFGTGYSSLSYLKHLPVDCIKVDRSFVQGIEHDRDGQAIVRSIVSLGLHLGHEVVAEGVETPAQAALLRQLGCRFAQGYLFSPALPAHEAFGLLDVQYTPVADGGFLPEAELL